MKQMQSTRVRTTLTALVLGAGAGLALYQPIIAQPSPGQGTGGAGNQGQRPGGPGPGRPPGRPRPEDGPPPCGPKLEELFDDLKIDSGQQAKIKAILDKQRADIRRAHEQARRGIDGVLTAEQRKQWQEIREEACPPPPRPNEADE